jgi:nitroreductase
MAGGSILEADEHGEGAAEVKAMYRPLADDGIVRRIVEAAAAAPSIHNTQPWRFRVVGSLRGRPAVFV